MHVNRFIYTYICHLTNSFNFSYIESSDTQICIYPSTLICTDIGVYNLYLCTHLPVTSPNFFVLLICWMKTDRISFDVTGRHT